MNTNEIRQSFVATVLIVAATMIAGLVLFPGCGTMIQDINSSEEITDENSLEMRPLPVYLDFGDISVPSELELDKDKSFVYETPGVKAGILVLTGRIDVSSLVAFFKESMPADNWTLANSFKYKNYILHFRKEDKTCLISLYDKLFTTVVEIRVGPLYGVVEKPE